MSDLLNALARGADLAGAGIGTILVMFVMTCAASLGVVTLFVVRIPADYFATGRRPPTGPTGARVAIAILKNAAGVALVLVGIVLSFPGIPGQGMLTVLVGLMLTDLPGVRKLERALASRRSVRQALDTVRAKFGRPPLRMD